MSFNAKIFAFSAAALLLVGGGVYTFMSNDEGNSPGDPVVASQVEAPEQPVMPTLQEVSAGQHDGKIVVSEPSEVKQATPPAQPTSQMPKKLTKEQLLPPPATEAEKMEKAAQQESNF